MTVKPLAGLVLAMFVVAASPARAAPEGITGAWVTAARDAVVMIGPCTGGLCGTIHRFLKTPPGGPGMRDINNPDPALRQRTILGAMILIDFRPDGDGWRGHIYDPKSGRTYRSTLVRHSNQLDVKGCFGPFCQTQVWTRAG